jgi:WD40 repeat protein
MCSLTFPSPKNGSERVSACSLRDVVCAHRQDYPMIVSRVSASWDKTLKMWDVASGTCQATLQGHRYLFWFVPLRRQNRRK